MKNGLIVSSNGDKKWYLYDLLHRVDGPAIEFAEGSKVWFIHGKYHRIDGPAFEYSDGAKLWFIHGEYIPCKDNEEFLRIVKLKAFW